VAAENSASIARHGRRLNSSNNSINNSTYGETPTAKKISLVRIALTSQERDKGIAPGSEPARTSESKLPIHWPAARRARGRFLFISFLENKVSPARKFLSPSAISETFSKCIHGPRPTTGPPRVEATAFLAPGGLCVSAKSDKTPARQPTMRRQCVRGGIRGTCLPGLKQHVFD